MFGLGAKLPIDDEARQWADDAFLRLDAILGRERMLKAEVVLPDDRFFPDRYDGSRNSVQKMAERVAQYMGIAPGSFDVHIYAENEDAWREDLVTTGYRSLDAAGLFFHEREGEKFVIGVHGKELKDPLALVAVLAHELAHVLLLGGGLMDRDAEDMEPMTDLCTAYLGLGFFTASAAFQFKKWTNDRYEGWSTSRKGYLSEEMWGYVLAKFAKVRGETKPLWARGLPTNVRGYFEQSAKCMSQHATRE